VGVAVEALDVLAPGVQARALQGEQVGDVGIKVGLDGGEGEAALAQAGQVFLQVCRGH
jgi:hypothetical protein